MSSDIGRRGANDGSKGGEAGGAPAASARRGDEGEAGLSRRQWVTLIILTLSTFLVLLDASVVNVALPPIARDLDGTIDGATWVIAGYILSFAALLVLFGRLGDVWGRRRLFVWGWRSSRSPRSGAPSRPRWGS